MIYSTYNGKVKKISVRVCNKGKKDLCNKGYTLKQPVLICTVWNPHRTSL